MTAKAIAVLGTASDVGKSLITAGICRLLRREGIRVAPFKAQNMSLNSFVTPEGGEIGRAQALQAEACRLLPHVDMNPILLKPEADNRSQVVVLGKVFAKLDASTYFDRREELFHIVQESYTRLAADHDMVVIEGAGSAAEVNLRDRDLVNWPVVQLANAKVVLVADIDRGGVFAQIIGTLNLLERNERERICGIVINKFRGDRKLFDDGIRFVEGRTGIPVLGLVPFVRDLTLDQEDILDVKCGRQVEFTAHRVNIGVLLLPHLSNFTDFNVLAAEHDVALRYISSATEVKEADVVVIPGSKNTLADLRYLWEKGFVAACGRHVSNKKELVGICGGYQMLGLRVSDPNRVEEGGSADGLGLLNVETEMTQDKRTILVYGYSIGLDDSGYSPVCGYQIRMGRTNNLGDRPRFALMTTTGCEEWDGAVNSEGLVWGTYVHGVFDQPGFRRQWLNSIRARKGSSAIDVQVSEGVTTWQQHELDRWTDHLVAHLDLSSLLIDLKQ